MNLLNKRSNVGRLLDYRIETSTFMLIVKVDFAKEVKATAWKPCATDSGATLETTWIALKVVDHDLDYFYGQLDSCASSILHIFVREKDL